MRIGTKVVIAGLLGIFVANFGSQVLAQESVRDAAIHRCIIQATREYPDASNESTQRSRTASYKACMTTAGQVP